VTAIDSVRERVVLKGGEGRAPVRDRLVAMLLLAALLHAIILLGLTFTAGDAAGPHQAPSLEVLLVSDDLPTADTNESAAYLAQRSQLGAGLGDAPVTGSPDSRHPQTPVPVPKSAAADEGMAILHSSAAGADIRYAPLPAAATPPVTSPLTPSDDAGPERVGRGDAPELLLRGRSRDLWVAPDTRASELAPYLVTWKRKVERVGTLNFPAAARSAGLSGSPVLEVSVRADGRLASVSVRRSSGYKALDDAALSILRLAGPFDPFPPELARNYAALRFAYQWEFVAGRLQSGAVNVTASPGVTSTPEAGTGP
jgi:protein TonB